MALPLIPVALGAAAGIGGGMLAEGILNNTKKSGVTYAPQNANVYHAPYENYQPTTMFAPQQVITMPSYQVSLGSSHSPQTMTTKQTATQDIGQYPTYDQPTTYPSQSSSAGSSGGFDSKTMILIALIAAGGIIVYGVVGK